MLKRLYVDNFKCLVNFELTVGPINLFLGSNGVGKSTVFDVLRKLQIFVGGDGHKVTTIFKSEDLTRWQTSLIQTFEMEIEGNGGVYKYELAVEHGKTTEQAKIVHERLWFDTQLLLKFEAGQKDILLYHDDSAKYISFPFKPSFSAVALLPEANVRAVWFREWLNRLIIVQLDPMMMAGDSAQEEIQLSDRVDNFVSWYRYISQDQGKTIEITNALQEVLPGFTYFKFDQAGEHHRVLKLFFTKDNDKGKLEYRLNELSDGQRVLIVLYTLIYFAQSQDYTLCIDEPENYVVLPEIQPWLTLLYDFCNEGKLQSLLISHHPELINYLAASAGFWFERQNNGPVRVRRITEDNQSGLSTAELIARGWLND